MHTHTSSFLQLTVGLGLRSAKAVDK